jgi:hypothetical protein
MVAKEKGNLLGIKGLNKKKTLKQLPSSHTKFLEDNFYGNGVEGTCNIHLKSHPIRMDV